MLASCQTAALSYVLICFYVFMGVLFNFNMILYFGKVFVLFVLYVLDILSSKNFL